MCLQVVCCRTVADAVVMIEYTEKFDENSIAVYDSVSRGRNVILEGEDLAAGEVFLKKGSDSDLRKSVSWLRPGIRRWRCSAVGMTVISTGDEIVRCRTGKIKKGQTRDINTYSCQPPRKNTVSGYGRQLSER